MPFLVHTVSQQDPIILHGYDWAGGLHPFSQLLPHITHAPATLLLSLSWTLLDKSRFRFMLKELAAYKQARPQHRIVILANMQEEKALLDHHNIPNILCSTNAFLDERLYFPLERDKVWQGIITARMRPFKRIHLVQELTSCCLITYPTYDDDAEYDAQLRRDVPHLSRPQYENGVFKTFFKEATLREYIARSHCGLALSEAEGGCFAAIEYLLCGLPVVSTPNLGGRNIFLHPDYSYFCHPNTHGVRLAVEAAQKCSTSPLDIRENCLSNMGYFRSKYIELLEEEAKIHGYGSTYTCDFPKIFCNKMITAYADVTTAIHYLARAGICESIPQE